MAEVVELHQSVNPCDNGESLGPPAPVDDLDLESFVRHEVLRDSSHRVLLFSGEPQIRTAAPVSRTPLRRFPEVCTASSNTPVASECPLVAPIVRTVFL